MSSAEPGSRCPDSTDLHACTADLVERYAARWSIEVAFAGVKNTTGVGEARNRTRRAVHCTVPFGLMTQSIVIIWYHLSGHHPGMVGERRARERWYPTKRHPLYTDMIIKLQRVLIAAQFLLEGAD
jgi:hypothetical protein